MKCLAKNTKGNRCKRNGNWKRFYFCKSHGIFKSDWFFLENQNYRIPISVFCSIVIFVLTAIVTWEIEEWWSKSDIRKNISTTTEIVEAIDTKFSGESNFNILLLPFGSSQTCNEETILCERELKKILISDDIDSNIEVKIDYLIQNKELIFTKEELNQLALNTKADLIIWGDYSKKCNFDSTLIQVNHFIPKNKDTENLTLDKFEISDYHPVSNLSELANGKVIGDIKNIGFVLKSH